MKRLIARYIVRPLMALTLKAWGRCWITTEQARQLNTRWLRLVVDRE